MNLSRTAPFTIALALVTAAGCDGTSPTAPSTSLRSEVHDVVGDAVTNPTYPQFTNPPDLVRATVDISAGNILFAVRLAAGTFDAHATVVLIDLDTDQNAMTGQARNGLGVDYTISMGAPGFGNPPLGNQFQVLRFGAPPGPYGIVGRGPVIVRPDGMSGTVPLTLLSNDDGRVNFRVQSAVVLTTISAIPFDVMPDVSLPVGVVQ
jgi:hypothetical protein